MEEENSPVKEYLFEYIKNSEKKNSKLFLQERMNLVIDEILNSCYDKVVQQENQDESLGVLATGILHYMLTNSMISSQRKVEYNGISIDIVIPDLKTLEKDPKKTLIIQIPNSSDKNTIKEKISELEKIQPEKQNIWLVLTKELGLKNKTYFVQKDGNFSNIIFDIAQFVNVHGFNKFKILRI